MLQRPTVARVDARSPLASKVLRRIFTLYFCVALGVTLVQAYFQYDTELKLLQREVAANVNLIEAALSNTIWEFDQLGTTAIVTSLSQNKSLAGIELDSDAPISLGHTPRHHDARQATVWQNTFSRLYEQEFSIRHPKSAHPDKLVGTLRVYVSADTVMQGAITVLLGIAVSATLKTAALWLILHFTISSMIARPLKTLAGRLNQINRENTAGLTLPQLDSEPRKSDEMTFLLRSFVAMRRALRRSQKKLLRHQSELEQKVADRTRELHDQAMHDALTGLPNRRAFAKVMAELCQTAGVQQQHVLCLIDLDHFKLVNDTLGHAAGDQALVEFTHLLRRNLRPDDTVARMGGDEFAILMRNCSSSDAQTKINDLQKQAASIVIERDGRRVLIAMSAGLVAFSPRTGEDLKLAMESADAACYAAKESGRHQVKIYNEAGSGMRRKADVKWINIIHKALAEDLFLLYVQPIHASSDNAIRNAEVLLRLGMDGTIVPPSAFLSAAERYGLSTRIDMWVFEHTLRYLVAHPELVAQLSALHINLSASTISDAKFYRFALRQLRQHPTLAGKICLEVTENVLIERLDDAVRCMNGLRRRGVSFSLDDFGHGASSYTYLQTLPISQVKIDGSFVRTIVDNEVSLAIVKSMTDIAHMAGMSVVAEYVENEAIAAKLRELQIDYLQGYLLNRPMPIEMFYQMTLPQAHML